MRFCPFCSAENAVEATHCATCARRLPPVPPRRQKSQPISTAAVAAAAGLPRPGATNPPPVTSAPASAPANAPAIAPAAAPPSAAPPSATPTLTMPAAAVPVNAPPAAAPMPAPAPAPPAAAPMPAPAPLASSSLVPGPTAQRRPAPAPEPRAAGADARRRNDLIAAAVQTTSAPPAATPSPSGPVTQPISLATSPIELISADELGGGRDPGDDTSIQTFVAAEPLADPAADPAAIARAPLPDPSVATRRPRTPSVPPPLPPATGASGAMTGPAPGPAPAGAPPPDLSQVLRSFDARAASQPGLAGGTTMPTRNPTGPHAVLRADASAPLAAPPGAGPGPAPRPPTPGPGPGPDAQPLPPRLPPTPTATPSAARLVRDATHLDPPATRIVRPDALADRPFAPPKVLPIPEIPEPGLVNSARYSFTFVRARWQRRGAIKVLGEEIKQDTSALDQVLGELGKAARGAHVEGRAFATENAAITAAEERRAKLEGDNAELASRRDDETRKFAEVERDRLDKQGEAERLLGEAQRELGNFEAQRRGLRDKRKDVERRQRAYVKSAEDREAEAGAQPMGDARTDLRRQAQDHRREAAALEPERQDIDRRLAALERPLADAQAKVDAAKAEVDAACRSLSDAREGHTHRLAELDAESKRKTREISLADAEILRRLVTLGTLVNLNRVERPEFAELYQRIDRLRGAIAARTTEIEKLTAEREAYDKASLIRGLVVIGGGVVGVVTLLVILLALL